MWKRRPGSGWLWTAPLRRLPSTGGTGAANGSRPARKGGAWKVTSGVHGLGHLKTTNSAFTGYIVTSSPRSTATDRIFGTSARSVGVRSSSPELHRGTNAHPGSAAQRVRRARQLECVDTQLFDMGKPPSMPRARALRALHSAMPNFASSAADLSAFGQDNPRSYSLVPIDEPHGSIEATVER